MVVDARARAFTERTSVRPSVRPSAANRITLLKRQPFAGRGGGGDPVMVYIGVPCGGGGDARRRRRGGDAIARVDPRKGSRGGYGGGGV